MSGRLIISMAGLLAGLILFQWVDAQDAQRRRLLPGTLVERLERFRESLLNQRDSSIPDRPGRARRPVGRTALGKAPRPASPARGSHLFSRPTVADPSGGRPDRTRGALPAATPQPPARPTTAALSPEFEPARRARPHATALGAASHDRVPHVASRPRVPYTTILTPGKPQQTPDRPAFRPARQEPTPASRTRPSPSDRPTPAARASAPAVQKLTPAVREPTPVVQDLTPGVREPTPVVQKRPVAAQEPTPAMRGEPTLAVREPVPVGQRSAAGGHIERLAPAPSASNGHVPDRHPGTLSNHRAGSDPHSGGASAARGLRPDGAVLFKQQVPRVTARVTGPRTITVGQPAKYRVTVVNQGQVVASRLTVQVQIPTWAELTGNTSTAGTAQVSTHTDDVTVLAWTIARLGSDQEQHLDLRMVPRRGDTLDLAVTCTCAAPVAQAVVQVQEPKLELVMAGPADALYGETKTFQVTVSNPGTGPAKNVVVDVLNAGGDGSVQNLHKLGTLAPGANRKIDVKLVARQTGKILLKVRATAAGGLHSESSKDVLVRRPALRVEMDGPRSGYAGTPATYAIRVTNPGTATTRSVTVTVGLPAHTEAVQSSDGGHFDAETRKITWRIATLPPKADRTLGFRCVLKSPGENQVEVFAQGAADLADSAAVATNVIGVADLTLDLTDPTGPVSVGQDAAYEIRIHNRGTKRAARIDVVTFFSEGIEPIRGEGAAYEIGPGQVAFHTIDGVDPGQKLVLTVHARASRPGNLVCRTEVLCSSVDIKLAAEETTRFYQRQGQPLSQARAPDARPVRR